MMVSIISSLAYSRKYFRSQVRKLATSANNFEGYQQPDPKYNAFEKATQNYQVLPCIILVRPYLDQNVGSVARAMLNFGLTELRIVQPNCDIYSDQARALASGAYEIVEKAKVFSTIEESVADLKRIMATSNRPRHLTQIMYTPSKAAEEAIKFGYDNEKVGILFGTERSGLSNDELAVADSMVTIPTFNHFSSLNLAQAVNIIGYELWNQYQLSEKTTPPSVWLQPKDKDRLANRDDLEQFFIRLERNLDLRQHNNDENRRKIVYRAIRGVFQRV
jgi:tRNA/rRNA methyltransferase